MPTIAQARRACPLPCQTQTFWETVRTAANYSQVGVAQCRLLTKWLHVQILHRGPRCFLPSNSSVISVNEAAVFARKTRPFDCRRLFPGIAVSPTELPRLRGIRPSSSAWPLFTTREGAIVPDDGKRPRDPGLRNSAFSTHPCALGRFPMPHTLSRRETRSGVRSADGAPLSSRTTASQTETGDSDLPNGYATR
jgi:hypothetical protein